MSFKIDDDNVLVRYNEVCGKTLKNSEHKIS